MKIVRSVLILFLIALIKVGDAVAMAILRFRTTSQELREESKIHFRGLTHILRHVFSSKRGKKTNAKKIQRKNNETVLWSSYPGVASRFRTSTQARLQYHRSKISSFYTKTVALVLGFFRKGVALGKHITLTTRTVAYKGGRAMGTGTKLTTSASMRTTKSAFVSLVFLLKRGVQRIGQIIFLPFRSVFRLLSSLRIPSFPLLKRAKKRGRKAKHPKPTFYYKAKLITFGAAFSFLFLFLPILFTVFLSELPNPHTLSATYIPKTTKIYDRNGNLLYEIFANQNRTLVPLRDIPQDLRYATIAIEDKDFYSHPGFDVRGITRAFISNVSSDEGLQGGSTITQQLIKSSLLTPETTISRKVKEVILAFWAERIYTKDKILEMYFNYVPYGGTAWGVESASEIYFGKTVNELNLAESAFLAGLPRAPSIYSPYSSDATLWKKRQRDVLHAMVRDGYISQAHADEAYGQELSFKTPDVPIKAPHFVMYVKDQLVKKYGISEVERGGLRVKTTLDLATQDTVEQLVANEVEASAGLNVQNGAALVTNPNNGDIFAMVGSRNYFDTENDGNVNITTALRQPGSTIKIVTYTLALLTGFTESSIIEDSPLTIRTEGQAPYSPVNYDGAFHGRVTLRQAFANSYNIPAVKLAQRVGVANLINFGKQMGITSWNNPSRYGVSITLGGAEVRMTDLATVFATIANEGKRVDLDPILEIQDASGQVLYKKDAEEKQIIDPGVAFIISDILADNNARAAAFGPASPLAIPGYKASVKTGTTDNKRDNWTVGFTDDLLVATWVGNNDNTPMSPFLTSGITGAAPMWNHIMLELLPKYATTSAEIAPENVVKRFCAGQERYYLKGTENSPECRGRFQISPSPRLF